jgi:integrase
MAAQELPHLHHEPSRHGQSRWYFRRGQRPRIRLPDDFGSREFLAAYTKALDASENGDDFRPVYACDTIAWLIEEYRRSGEWLDLSPATRRQREVHFRHIIDTAGDFLFAELRKSHILNGVQQRRDRPAAARHYHEALRGLFGWAHSREHVLVDPTDGVRVKRKQNDGFKIWTMDDVLRFEKRWEVGTRERLAFDLLTFTGLRRGDVVRLGPKHVKGGVATIVCEKRGKGRSVGETVHIRLLGPLVESIEAAPTGDDTFIVGMRWKARTKEGFGNWFRKTCNMAGCPDVSAHGLRKVAATRAGEAGATTLELMAMFGWTNPRTAEIYTRKADRLRLAMSGSAKVAGQFGAPKGASAPAPSRTFI